MQVAQADEREFEAVSGHREGDIAFKRLLAGPPGAPDNYELFVVRQRGFYATPRHRHNYDQFRYVLEGEYAYAGRRVMCAGTLGYFPEGTPYGPQAVKDCVVVGVQFGGISGNEMLDFETLRCGHKELAALDRFEKGVFIRSDAPAATRSKQDGYEAIWEHMNGRRLVYAQARYDEPVVCDPEALAWEPAATEGVTIEPCGSFAGGAAMGLVSAAQGASWPVPARAAATLLFVLEEAGRIGRTELRPGTAVAFAAGEGAAVAARSGLAMFHLTLPVVPAAALRRAA